MGAKVYIIKCCDIWTIDYLIYYYIIFISKNYADMTDI